MFVAMGVGAYSVGMFHLFTHAFFKALLFLGSGSVIIAMHHEQDIRHMGGLRTKIPFTYWTMVIGTLALTGFPGFAGYFSKDAIIDAAYAGKNPAALYAYLMTLGAAGLTAFYSWRLIYKTFHGQAHDEAHFEAAHESPPTMLIPLFVLALGCVLAGLPFFNIFVGSGVEGFFGESLAVGGSNTILEEMEHVSMVISLLPTALMLIGWAVAWLFYIARPELPVELARQHSVLYRFLLNKWYFDELYDFVIVRPTLWIGRLLWKGGDGWLIDGFGPDGVSARVLDVTRNVVRLQTGYMYHYAFAMLIGVALFMTWFTWLMFSGGGH
jgi:NADH-quinone oxidoreductase subunit L